MMTTRQLIVELQRQLNEHPDIADEPVGLIDFELGSFGCERVEYQPADQGYPARLALFPI